MLALAFLVWLAQAARYRVLPTHVERWSLLGRRRYSLQRINHIREQVIWGSYRHGAIFYFVIDHDDEKMFRFTSSMPEASALAEEIERRAAESA